jgi:hypothetical protein
MDRGFGPDQHGRLTEPVRARALLDAWFADHAPNEEGPAAANSEAKTPEGINS